jgi:hypothetical protein
MKGVSIVILVVGAALMAEPASAQEQGFANLHAIALMDGKCTSLVIADKPATHNCTGKITNSMYKTGRSGFIFTAGDLAVVTFSGADSPAKGNQATVRLDKVIFTLIGTGTEPNVMPAKGSCTYTNPYAGPSRINCTATTEAGRFSGSFVSDGREPDIQRF